MKSLATQLNIGNLTSIKPTQYETANENRTGLSSPGLAGCVILGGVIFQFISPWWLLASAFLILVGTGLESGKSTNT